MTETIRVLIADDHPIVRQGLQVLLSAQPDIDLVAEAVDGVEAVRKAIDLDPNVIVLDLKMPGKDGLTAIREIKQARPHARILVLTSFVDDDTLVAAVKEGAVGFLLKDSSPDRLLEGIRLAHQGKSLLHPTIASKLMHEVARPSQFPSAQDPLTSRELDVLGCLARGLSNREIANELTVSVRTVTSHVRNILDKLHLANRTQAALYAVEQGIVSKHQD